MRIAGTATKWSRPSPTSESSWLRVLENGRAPAEPGPAPSGRVPAEGEIKFDVRRARQTGRWVLVGDRAQEARRANLSRPIFFNAELWFIDQEAKMIIPKYTLDDFKKLPLRAIVAFAVRCARRVEYLAIPAEGHPEHERCRKAVSDAIQLAEDFVRGSPCTACESVIPDIEAARTAAHGDLVRENAIAAVLQAAYTAATALHAIALSEEPEERHLFSPPTRSFAHLAELSAELAALDAFTTAVDASDATGYPDDLIGGAVADYEKLLGLKLGGYPSAGQPFDPSPRGPLGPLWPEHHPLYVPTVAGL